MEDVKERFRFEIHRITVQSLNNIQEEFLTRLAHGQTVNGEQFEPLW